LKILKLLKQNQKKKKSQNLLRFLHKKILKLQELAKKILLKWKKVFKKQNLFKKLKKEEKIKMNLESKQILKLSKEMLIPKKSILELEREVEFSRLEKQRSVDIKLADEKAQTAKEEARKRYESEEAYIMAEEQIKMLRLLSKKMLTHLKLLRNKRPEF
jgi:uncharacterized membrane protein YqiK